MNTPTRLLTAVVAAASAGTAASAATTTFNGTLDPAQTWDRTEGIPLADAADNNNAYSIFLFTFDADDPDVNFIVSAFHPQLDTTMYLFTDAWEVADPLGAVNTANALQYNDDRGGAVQSHIGSGGSSSPGDPALGTATQSVVAGQVYGLIVSGYQPASETPVEGQWSVGGISVDIVTSGNATAAALGIPEPGSLALLGLGGLMLMRRRRP